MFPIRRVNREDAIAQEYLGTKSKFWFLDGDRRMLFKAEDRGTGEDWAEKVACHLCETLGLPHVHYDLAELFEAGVYVQPGVVCETCAAPPLSLILGNQLLLARDPAYPADDARKYKVRKHTVAAVAEVIQSLNAPAKQWMASMPNSTNLALDIFVGYIMLDAWIANQDRHHENWAALQDDTLRLAPTFDHGASLARNLTDAERQERLTTADVRRGVAYFVRRARSAFYLDADATKPLSTIEAFYEFAKLSPDAADAWLRRLATIDSPAVSGILEEVPEKRMSRVTKNFTLQLLVENQRRLLDRSV